MENTWDTVIVGGSAAGLAAALMLGRARRKVLVIDSGKPRNRYAKHMYGVLGHDGMNPADLVKRGRQEVSAYGVEVRSGLVTRLEETESGIIATIDDGSRAVARTAVIATGVTDQLPDIPGLAEHWGTSVLHCPYCHGWEVRDQRLAVLATSPLSLHQVQLIRQWSNNVVVFAAELGPLDPAVAAKLLARDLTLVSSPVIAVMGDGAQVKGVRTADGKVTEVDAIFTSGTPIPHDSFLSHLNLERAVTPAGDLMAVSPSGRTSNSRIWAVGNVVSPFANVPMAIGAGTLAGADINGVLVTEDFDLALERRR